LGNPVSYPQTLPIGASLNQFNNLIFTSFKKHFYYILAAISAPSPLDSYKI